jgi:2,3,4,5-tetrahydropyridine-2-carboxylate N-succinyltransferase
VSAGTIHDAEYLREFFERDYEAVAADPAVESAHEALLQHLEAGTLRSAERGKGGDWTANAWIKRAILAGFKRTKTIEYEGPGFGYFDKSGYPPRAFVIDSGVRLVPGGSSVRRGAYVAKGVVIMPPAFINVGAWVGAGTMVDSHALVGSCAQVGERVHLSAGAQIGGVLEPAGAVPVVVENDVFVGALAGVFEGVVVHERAVLAAGVVLTGSSVVYDLVNGRELRREVPAGAVVVPGTRPGSTPFAIERGLQLAAPMIVKYRDAKTDAATALEGALR